MVQIRWPLKAVLEIPDGCRGNQSVMPDGYCGRREVVLAAYQGSCHGHSTCHRVRGWMKGNDCDPDDETGGLMTDETQKDFFRRGKRTGSQRGKRRRSKKEGHPRRHVRRGWWAVVGCDAVAMADCSGAGSLIERRTRPVECRSNCCHERLPKINNKEKLIQISSRPH